MRQIIEAIEERTDREGYVERSYIEWQTKALGHFIIDACGPMNWEPRGIEGLHDSLTDLSMVDSDRERPEYAAREQADAPQRPGLEPMNAKVVAPGQDRLSQFAAALDRGNG